MYTMDPLNRASYLFQHAQLKQHSQRQFLYRYSGLPGHNICKVPLPRHVIRGVLSPAFRAPISLCSEEHELIC
jgi:hypothetical protein